MHCEKARPFLQLYLDHQLTLEQLRELETHIATCESCRYEMFLLEEVSLVVRRMEVVAEPVNLTSNIMQRVALSPQLREEARFVLLRPSFIELLATVLLASVAMLGIVLEQPSVRAVLPFANGHDEISLLFANVSNVLIRYNTETLTILWIVGTILGIWITLTFVGEELRKQWLKAMMDRLPVW